MSGIYSAHDAIIGVQGAMGGGRKSRCSVELTDDPVGSDLTVTAADCWVYYDNMKVPPGITVTVETNGHLIDRVGVGYLNYMLNLGDSKTAGDTWPTQLLALVGALDDLHPRQSDFSISGAHVELLASSVVSLVPDTRETVYLATLNVGINDVARLTAEEDFKTYYRVILDTLLDRWPASVIYVALIWARAYASGCDVINGWIETVVAEYDAGVFVGMDERIWLEGGDDGATNTVDGTHYSEAGEIAAAAAWFATIGA